MAYTGHEVWLCDYQGRRLDLVDDFTNASFSRIVNGVGTCNIVLPAHYSESYLRIGSWIEYWRSPIGNDLQPEGLYLLDGYVLNVDNKGVRSLTVKGSHANQLLQWRVAKTPNIVPTVSLTMPGDDMIKKLARDSMTAMADPDRNMASYYNFQVGNDLSEAPVHTREVNGVSVFDTANNIAAALMGDGLIPYWLYWEIIPIAFNHDFTLELRTYGGYDDEGQRARNRGPYSLNPMVLSVDANTLSEAMYERNHSKEWTYVYAGGKTNIAQTGAEDWVFEYNDDLRLNLFPANRREKFINSGKTDAAVTPEALKSLRDGRPIHRVNGKFTENQAVRYGVEVMLGDRLAFDFDGHIQTVRAKSVTITLQAGKETVDVNLEPVEFQEA